MAFCCDISFLMFKAYQQIQYNLEFVRLPLALCKLFCITVPWNIPLFGLPYKMYSVITTTARNFLLDHSSDR